MPVSVDDPAVQRRRLRIELRALRKRSGHTQRDVAEAMDWSPSKLIRIENGDVRITPIDLRALLAYYGVRDSERVESLVDMARSSRQDLWAEFRDVHTGPWLTFLGYESSASVMRTFDTLFIPGILQTEEYALAVYAARAVPLEVAERRWEARLRRQSLHERDEPPEMYFIVDESTLRRQVGGTRVMHRQLEYLRELGDLSHITVRVVPFTVGAYFSLGRPFVHLEFPDASDDDLLHIEDFAGGVTMRDDVEATSDAVENFLKLEDIALTTQQTRRMLDELIEAGAKPGTGTKVATAATPKEQK